MPPSSTSLFNVLFLLVDDWGSYDVAWRERELGRVPLLKTPHLDALAGASVRLSNYYVQPICTPTRSALLSARYPIHTGLQDGIIEAHARVCLPPAFGTMADAFRSLGYATHMVGKWHVGIYKDECLPWHRGFDSFLGFLTGSEHHYTKVQRVARGSGNMSRLYPDFRTHTGPLPSDCVTPPFGPAPQPPSAQGDPRCYSTTVFTAEAVRIIAASAGPTSAASPRPFFLYLALQAVHEPVEVPRAYEELYAGQIADGVRRTYAGMVSAVDECVANVTAALAAAGQLESTIVAVSSDNGGWSGFGGVNYPYRGHKTTLWEGGVRALGLLSLPGLAPALAAGGAGYAGLFHVTDWLPTLVRGAAGVDVGSLGHHFHAIDGVDQWAALLRVSGATHQPSVSAPVSASRRGLAASHQRGGVDSARRGGSGGDGYSSAGGSALAGYPRDSILHNIEGVNGSGAAVLRVGAFKLMLNMGPARGFDGWCDLCLNPRGCIVPPGAGPASSAPAGRLVQPGGELCCWTPPLPGSGCANGTRAPSLPPVLLYNIEEDPRELRDLAPRLSATVARLLRVMGRFNRSAAPCCICTGSAPDAAEMALPPLDGFWFRFRDQGSNGDLACALMNEPPWRSTAEWNTEHGSASERRR